MHLLYRVGDIYELDDNSTGHVTNIDAYHYFVQVNGASREFNRFALNQMFQRAADGIQVPLLPMIEQTINFGADAALTQLHGLAVELIERASPGMQQIVDVLLCTEQYAQLEQLRNAALEWFDEKLSANAIDFDAVRDSSKRALNPILLCDIIQRHQCST